MNDNEAIQACLAGNSDAFAEIIHRYESKIAGTVVGMLGRCPEAEDVGQETFIRFYNNLNNFRGEASVGTYLTRIAINLSLNELKRRQRKSSRDTSIDDPEVSESLYENRNRIEIEETRDVIYWAISQLEPKLQSALVLRMMDECSTEETAEILQIPIGTVLSRFSRAKKQLLKILKPYQENL